jgi:hypothetical protein
MKEILSLVAICALLLSCSNYLSSGNAVINNKNAFETRAEIFEPDGRTPAKGAVVKLFRVNAIDGRPVSDQITDSAGRYSVALIPDGAYNVWAEKDSNVAFQDSVVLTAGYRSLILKTDGTLWQCGFGGQLTPFRTIPPQ